jgi:hypothetical protein
MRGARSAAADGMDDLDAIAGLQLVLDVAAARHDLAVHLDGDAASAEDEQLEYVCGARAGRHVTRLAVQYDFHRELRHEVRR